MSLFICISSPSWFLSHTPSYLWSRLFVHGIINSLKSIFCLNSSNQANVKHLCNIQEEYQTQILSYPCLKIYILTFPTIKPTNLMLLISTLCIQSVHVNSQLGDAPSNSVEMLLSISGPFQHIAGRLHRPRPQGLFTCARFLLTVLIRPID